VEIKGCWKNLLFKIFLMDIFKCFKKNKTWCWKMKLGSLKNVIIIYAVLAILSGQAFAWSWNIFDSKDNSVPVKLNDIQSRVTSLSRNQIMMKYLNSNMFDQGVETIEISIRDDDHILKNYYLVRAADKKEPAILKETPQDNKGVTWTFRPGIDEVKRGLDLAEDNLWVLEKTQFSTYEKSGLVYSILKGYYLYSNIEKENVPSLNEIIKKSHCSQCKKALSLIGM